MSERAGSSGQPQGRARVLAVLLVSVFMFLMNIGIVNVALPSIQHGLSAPRSTLQWVLSGYALTFGVVLVSAGRAGDIFSKRTIFSLGVLTFTAGAFAAGCATSPQWLVGARLVQGLGAGVANPQILSIVQHQFPPAERGRAFGLFGTAVGLSLASGPFLGGLLIDIAGPHQGWRWTFFVNVPVGVLVCVLALLWLPRERSASRSVLARDLDMGGCLLLAAATFLLLFPFVGRDGAWRWAALPVAAAVFYVWVRWESGLHRRGRRPMVDLGITQVKSFTNGCLVTLFYFLGVSSTWVLVALYMQDGLGHSALEAGTIGIPNALLSALSAFAAGRLVKVHGRRVVVVGMVIVLLGLALSVGVVALQGVGAISEWWLVGSLAVVGLGQGAVITPNQLLTLQAVPLAYAGSSAGVMQSVQRIATAVGMAMITALAFHVLETAPWSAAMSAGIFLIAIFVAFALVVSIKDLRTPPPGIGRTPLEGT